MNTNMSICLYMWVYTRTYTHTQMGLICDRIHFCVCMDVFICVTWRLHVCDMTHPSQSHTSRTRTSFICVTWLWHLCDMTHSMRANDPCVCNNIAYMNTNTYVCFYTRTYTHTYIHTQTYVYGVATICRLLKIMGLFCERALWKRRYSAKKTYYLKEPTNRSHPICHDVIMSPDTHTYI